MSAAAATAAPPPELERLPAPVTLCPGWHPVAERYLRLKALGAPVIRIGDAIASRSMMEAVRGGERVARHV